MIGRWRPINLARRSRYNRPDAGPYRLALGEAEGRLLFAGGDLSPDQAGTIDGTIVTGRAAAARALTLLNVSGALMSVN